jgi:hypothetical protein
VKYKAVLKKLASADLIKAAACTFDNSTSALTLSEAVLTPTNMMVDLELCKDEFRADWEALATGSGFAGAQVPQNFLDFLIAHVGAKVGEAVEYNLWQGNFDPLDGGGAPSYTSFDGLLKKMDDANGGAPDIDITAALSTSNILTFMGSVVDAIPTALQGNQNVKIWIGPATWSLYLRKICDSGLGFQYAMSQDLYETVYGYQIRVCPGIPSNCIVAAEPENLFFGTDLLSDHSQVRVVDTSDTLADDNVRMRMKFSAGTQIGHIADIVLAYLDS